MCGPLVQRSPRNLRHAGPPQINGDEGLQLPYELVEEIIRYALISEPRMASRTLKAVALTSQTWNVHARRLAIVGISFNLEPRNNKNTDKKLAFIQEAVTLEKTKMEPCRSLFVRMPYCSSYSSGGGELRTQRVLQLLGPTLWSLEVQGGLGPECWLGRDTDHTREEVLRLSGVEDWQMNGHWPYRLPLLQRLWVSDLPAQATLAIIRVTGENELDCHRSGIPGIPDRPKLLRVAHAFESYTAKACIRLPREVLGPPKDTRLMETETKVENVEEEDRVPLEVFVDRRADLARFLARIKEVGLPAGIEVLELMLREKGGNLSAGENSNEVHTLLRQNGWECFRSSKAP
ncbi:hypothetical protein FS837_009976 [Tulasnella sp. UAMH 9824]|nr:hypothetical protein FS837_009976 [Tulasnella sp. UAMH 9824]